MKYEVEEKFPVADLEVIRGKLEGLGIAVGEAGEEVDVYYRHPCRDFAATDEAFRIRRAGRGQSITYKGPKVDRTTKTRLEIDLPLPPGRETFPDWSRLLEALGFAPVAEVRKRRRRAVVPWHGRRVQVTLDEVVEVGRFVELELVTEAGEVGSAKASIGSLASALGLAGSQTKSYLELLLEGRGSE